MPIQERPREKLIAKGTAALSGQELPAVLGRRPETSRPSAMDQRGRGC
jgi:DNA repair protein RadC